MHLLGGDDCDALCDRPLEHVALNRRANTDLDHPARIDEAFVDGVIEHRTMRKGLAEIIRPRIDMSVEMNERERTVSLRASARNKGERDAVLPAERYEVVDACGLILDQLQARSNIAERDTKIPDIREHELGGSIHAVGWSPSTSIRLA